MQIRRAARNDATKKRVDNNRTHVDFELGEHVMLFWPAPKKGISPKLFPKWSGPFVIQERLSDVTYRVKLSDNKSIVIHVQRLRKLSIPISHNLIFETEE